jgi:hypothetical protein
MNVFTSMFSIIRSDWITPFANTVMTVLIVLSIIFHCYKRLKTSFRILASAWGALTLICLYDVVYLTGVARHARFVIENEEVGSPYITLSPLWFWAVFLFRITGGFVICLTGVGMHSFIEWWLRRKDRIVAEYRMYVFLISVGMLVFIIGLRGITIRYGEGILWGRDRGGSRRSVKIEPIVLPSVSEASEASGQDTNTSPQ